MKDRPNVLRFQGFELDLDLPTVRERLSVLIDNHLRTSHFFANPNDAFQSEILKLASDVTTCMTPELAKELYRNKSITVRINGTVSHKVSAIYPKLKAYTHYVSFGNNHTEERTEMAKTLEFFADGELQKKWSWGFEDGC